MPKCGICGGEAPKQPCITEDGKCDLCDIFLLATDGLWETRNEKGEMFGKDIVKKIIRDNSALSAKEIKSILFSSVKKFMHGYTLDDDLTIVVAKFD